MTRKVVMLCSTVAMEQYVPPRVYRLHQRIPSFQGPTGVEIEVSTCGHFEISAVKIQISETSFQVG